MLFVVSTTIGLETMLKKVMPYNSEHQVENDGDLGTSLLAMHELLESKGFNLIAVDSSGTNAFFVKKEFASYFEILSPVKSWRSVDRVITHF